MCVISFSSDDFLGIEYHILLLILVYTNSSLERHLDLAVVQVLTLFYPVHVEGDSLLCTLLSSLACVVQFLELWLLVVVNSENGVALGSFGLVFHTLD